MMIKNWSYISALRYLRENRRMVAIVALLVLLVAIISFPMRLALALAPFEKGPVQIFSARGTVWDGRMHDVKIGIVPLGTIDAAMHFWPLFVGRETFSLAFDGDGQAAGAGLGNATLSHQWAWSGYSLSDMNASLPVDRLFAPLPARLMTFEEFNVRYGGEQCLSAGGRVRLSLQPLAPGLSEDTDMAGVPRCSDNRLLLPLANASGTRKLDIFIDADGQYRMTLRLETLPDIDPVLLESRGFERSGGRWQMQLGGRF